MADKPIDPTPSRDSLDKIRREIPGAFHDARDGSMRAMGQVGDDIGKKAADDIRPHLDSIEKAAAGTSSRIAQGMSRAMARGRRLAASGGGAIRTAAGAGVAVGTAARVGKAAMGVARTVGRRVGGPALEAGRAAVATVRRSFKDADALNESLEKLERTARRTGQSMNYLEGVSGDARKEFGLTRRAANDLTAEVVTLTSQAGQVELTSQALRAVLDVGAERGLSTGQTVTALDAAVRGLGEGTTALFDMDPQTLYGEYADSIGKTVGQLTQQDRAQAVLTMAMKEGAAAQGEYAKYMETAEGKQEKFRTKTEETSATLGRALEPARRLWTNAVDGIRGAMYDAFTWMMEQARRFIVRVQFLGADLGYAWAMVPIRLKELLAASLETMAGWADSASGFLAKFGINIGEGFGNNVRGSVVNLRQGLAQEARNAREELSRDYAEIQRQTGETYNRGSPTPRPPRPQPEPRQERNGNQVVVQNVSGGDRIDARRSSPATPAKPCECDPTEMAAARQEAVDHTREQAGRKEAEHREPEERERNAREDAAAALDKEISALAEGRRLNLLRAEDLERIDELERSLRKQLLAGNGSLQDRNRIQRQLNTLAEAKREKEKKDSRFTARNVWGAIEQGAKNAGDAIGASFGKAFEMLGRDITNTGAAFDALWAGFKKGVAEAVAEEARVNAKAQFASAIGQTAKGLGYLASMNFPSAANAFASAAQHMAAGAAWSVLAGAVSSAGGGGAGAGGGSSSLQSSRDAGSAVAQSAEKRGPEIHIYVDGIDPTNPRHQKLTQQTLKGVRERYGSDGTVTYAPRRAG